MKSGEFSAAAPDFIRATHPGSPQMCSPLPFMGEGPGERALAPRVVCLSRQTEIRSPDAIRDQSQERPDFTRATHPGSTQMCSPLPFMGERPGERALAPRVVCLSRQTEIRSPDAIRVRLRNAPDFIRATHPGSPQMCSPLSFMGEGPGERALAPRIACLSRQTETRSPDAIRDQAQERPGFHPGYAPRFYAMCCPLPFMGEGLGERALAPRTACLSRQTETRSPDAIRDQSQERPGFHLDALSWGRVRRAHRQAPGQRSICSTRRFSSASSR